MAKPLTVLHVMESFATGALLSLRDMVQAVTPHGVEVTILHGMRPDTPADFASLFGPSVTLIRWCAVRHISPRADVAAWRQFRHVVAEVRPDVIHSHSSKGGFIARCASPPRLPVAYTPHGFGFFMPVSRAARAMYVTLECAAGRMPRAYTLAVGDDEFRVAGRLGQRAYRCPDIADFTPYFDAARPRTDNEEPGNGKIVVVTTGGVRPHKNPEIFAEIARRFPEMEFLWVGGYNGPYRIPSPPANLRVTGWIGEDEVAAALARADMFVSTSHSEAMSKSALEAMASGLPCILSDVIGNRALARVEAGNLLARDVEGFCRAIGDLASAPQERLRLGARNRDWTRARFDMARNGAELVEIYRRLARGAPPLPADPKAVRGEGLA